MKITVLMEDTPATDDMRCEMGLSLFIETPNAALLMDTGKSGNFTENAKNLGIDINAADAAVISHAHYDHSGGLGCFFQANTTGMVYMHTAAAGHYYGNIGAKLPPAVSSLVHPFVKYSKTLSREIGPDLDLLAQKKKQIRYIDSDTEPFENVFILTSVQKKHALPIGNKFMLAPKNGRLYPDPFEHEIILVIRQEDGLVLFSGCCHSGILNMIETVKQRFPEQTIKAVVGGFHLVLQPGRQRMAGSKKMVESIADAFDAMGIQQVYTGHCTGKAAFEVLKGRLGSRLHYLGCGSSYEI